MSYISFSKRSYGLTLAFFCIAALGASVGAFTSYRVQENQQARTKVLDKGSSPNEPIAITDIKVADKAISFGDKLDGDEDWLKDVSFKIKNISDKPIVYAEIDLEFPETKSSGNLMVYPIQLGQRPGLPNRNQEPLYLPPGETLDIQLPSKYDAIKRFINHRQQMSDIHRGVVRIGFVVFSDMTGWDTGTALRQDPHKPTRFIPIS